MWHEPAAPSPRARRRDGGGGTERWAAKHVAVALLPRYPLLIFSQYTHSVAFALSQDRVLRPLVHRLSSPPSSLAVVMVSKLLLLGATGRVGQLIVQAALQRGLSVVALVRNPAKLSELQQQHSSRLSLVQGLPTSAADLKSAIAGCDAVLSALGVVRTSDMPWGKPVGSVTLMSDSLQ